MRHPHSAEAAPRLRRRAGVVLLLLLASCGAKKEPDALDSAYNSYKYRLFILGQSFPGGRSLDGTVDLDAGSQAGGAADWIEVAINGDILGRTTGSSRVSLNVKFRPGPNKVSFFISAVRRYWEYDVNARQNTRVEITPKDANDWNVEQQFDQ